MILNCPECQAEVDIGDAWVNVSPPICANGHLLVLEYDDSLVIEDGEIVDEIPFWSLRLAQDKEDSSID